jgi:Fe-S cluster biogenesis protein NfuA
VLWLVLPFGTQAGPPEDDGEQRQRDEDEEPFVPRDPAVVSEEHAGNLWASARVGDSATHRRDWSVMKDAVLKTIEVIRPALQADGGDMILRSIDEETGRIEVELIGACGTCPASTVTMKAGIERILKDRVEGVTEVVAV